MTAASSDRWDAPARRVRASDADRSQVTSALAEHYAHGRLDDAEFDERSTRALSAVYVDELDRLFHDLPQERAARAVPVVTRPQRPQRPPRPRTSARRPPTAVFVVLAIALIVLTRGAALWLLPLMWVAAGSARSCSGPRHHRWAYAPPPPVLARGSRATSAP